MDLYGEWNASKLAILAIFARETRSRQGTGDRGRGYAVIRPRGGDLHALGLEAAAAVDVDSVGEGPYDPPPQLQESGADVATNKETLMVPKTVKDARCQLPWRRGISLATILLLGAAGGEVSAQQMLDDLRHSVRSQPERPAPAEDDPPERKRRERRNRPRQEFADCDDPESDFWGELLTPFVAPFVWAGATMVTSPFWGPAHLVEDHYDSAGYFPDFPYQGEVDGYMMRDPWLPAEPRTWSLRLQGEYVDNFDALSSVGGHLLWESTHRVGIDSAARFWHEDLGTAGSEELWIGDTNLVFRFAESPHLQMRAGLGFNWLADSEDKDFGVNFTYGGDWYPLQPLIVSAELDLGRLGRATYFHARCTTGIQWRRYEVFAGYDYLDVGTVQIQGLVSGLRLWF